MGAKQGPSSWQREFSEKGYYPLRINGKASTMEVTKIDEKSLSDSLFEVPRTTRRWTSRDDGDMMGGAVKELAAWTLR